MRLNEPLCQNLPKAKDCEASKSQEKTVNTVDEEPHSEDSVNFLQLAKLYQSDYSSGEYNTVALIQSDIAKTEPLNLSIKIGNISTALLVDSCSTLSG